MAAFPESYTDPLYDKLDAANEQKLGLPVGLLSSIRTKGEKSNNGQVSSASAKSPYQIIPATRDAAIKKYGIDPLLSPENASEVAGRLLADSLKRNNNDPAQAVGEYVGGVNRDNWGKTTNAYINRVMVGQQKSKIDALSQGFAQFMVNNPAQAATTTARPIEAPKEDVLASGFGQWLSDQNKPTVSAADMVPSTALPDGSMPTPLAKPVPAADPSLVDKIIGSGEAALTLVTGATTGALGMANGAVSGAIGNLTNGAYGTTGGVEESMGKGAESATYIPRTAMGQEYAAELGKTLESTLPAIPLTAELSAIGKGSSAAAVSARDLTAGSVARIRTAAPAIANRVERVLRRNPDPATPTPGTLGSAGSAATDAANLRAANADNLPVPIPLTEGQATRSPEQLRFELETSKGADGGKFRDRYSDQNEKIQKNFDAFIDQTGAEAPDVTQAGKVVDKALRAEAARNKAEVRVKYANADRSPEAGAAVTLDDAVQFLNDSAPDAVVSPLLSAARARAIRLGIAAEDANGSLVPLQTTVRDAELYRRAINQATDYEPTNIRNSAILKGSIDAATEPLAGPLYREARRAREVYANRYENRAVVADLLNNKKGMNDRKVAIEDVFKHTILDSDKTEVSHVRSLLFKGGEEGEQAWRELQGQTLSWLKDEALKNVATDQRGNRIVSPAQLDRAIRKLDSDGKLDFVFGKQGAEKLRDINDLTKVVMTAPPGVVNHSNTASVIAGLLTESGISGAAFGLPVPVVTGTRLLLKHVKDRKLRARIEHSLNAPQQRRNAPPAL